MQWFRSAALIGLLTVASGSAEAQVKSVLHQVSATTQEDGLRIEFSVTAVPTITRGRLREPERIYVDLGGTRGDLNRLSQYKLPQNAWVRSIRYGRHEPNILRVVLDVADGVQFQVVPQQNPPMFILNVSREGTESTSKTEPAPVAENDVPREQDPSTNASFLQPPAAASQTVDRQPAVQESAPVPAIESVASGGSVSAKPDRDAERTATLVSLKGRVTASNLPIPGASVTATNGTRQISAATDVSGTYLLEGLEPGAWRLHVEKFGFTAMDRDVSAPAQDAEEVWALTLRPRPAAPKPRAARQGGGGSQPEESAAPAEEPSRVLQSSATSDSFLISGSSAQGLQLGNLDIPARGWSNGRTTRRRSNGFRGTVTWTARNAALDARPYSISGESRPKPDYSQNRIFSTFSGPLRMPKFLSDQGRANYSVTYNVTRAGSPVGAFATVPTALERSGDFSASFARGPVQVYDPLNGQLFPGNRLPLTRIRSASLGLAQFIPLPTSSAAVQNYQLLSRVSENTHDLRGTLNLNKSKNRISLSPRYRTSGSQQLQTMGYRDQINVDDYSSTVSWGRAATSKLTLSSWFSAALTVARTTPFFAQGENVAAKLGIQGTSSLPGNYGPPTLNFTNFGSLTDVSYQSNRQSYSGGNFSAYYSSGAHNMSVGVDYSRNFANIVTDENGRGTFLFSGLATSALDAKGSPVASTGFDYADFLLGRAQSASVRYGASHNRFRNNIYGISVTDDWRATQRLTFSLGFRYDYSGPFTERDRQMVNLDIAPDFTAAAVVRAGESGPYSGQFPQSLVNPDRNNFAPRVGFAWTPSAKHSTTFRGGYGIYYNATVGLSLAQRLASQPPLAKTGILTTSSALPLTIEDGFVAVAAQTTTGIRNTYAVDRRYRTGYAQIWNYAVTQQLARNLVLEIGYVGTKGTRLGIQRLPNRALPGSPLNSEQRRRIPNAVGFTYDASDGNSILHSGQVRIVRRFQGGLSMNLLYTYAKSIDNASTFGGGIGTLVQDDTNLRAERGLSSFDVRQTLSSSYAVLSPFGGDGAPIKLNPKLAILTKDWNFQGTINASSARWVTARVLGNRADAGGTGSVGNSRANATGLPVRNTDGSLNPAAFSVPLAGQFGNAARNTIPLPAQLTLDLSVGRTFLLDDRRSLEFRAESSNFANIVNITGIGSIVNASNFGVATGAAPMRTHNLMLRLRF